MDVSARNLNPNALDTVQRGSIDVSGAQDNIDGTAKFDWFLPGGIDNLSTINAVINADLQGATPQNVADRVLSHIGA